MSRVGKLPIPIPNNVKIDIDGVRVVVTGPKGTLSRDIRPEVRLHLEDGRLLVTRPSDEPRDRAMLDEQHVLPLESLVLEEKTLAQIGADMTRERPGGRWEGLSAGEETKFRRGCSRGCLKTKRRVHREI